ncbi:MAG: lamin tail domain-containing protein, partial [Sedimentisphaerales bacterium]|nr:lamin tail domain-containing protein [Sedimentisphaerales bacterium]
MRLSLLIGLIAAFLAVSVQAELVHRYTFNNNVQDSVGTAHGTLVVKSVGAYYSNGLLYLNNNKNPLLLSNDAVNYVDLPNGIISSLGTGMTIETWACWFGPSGTDNQRFFIFGSGDIGEDESSASNYSDFLMLTVERFTNRNSIATGESYPTHVYFDAELPTNTMIHFAITWDDTKGIASLYKNGQLLGSCPTRLRLAELNDINNWLGRDIWLGAGLNGAYSDFRIYNTPLTAEMIQASYAAGANPATMAIEHILPTCISPADNSASAAGCSELNWQPDSNSDIVSQNVYFGPDLTGVLQADATSTEYFLGNVSGTTTSISLPYTLESGKTYYWRIEEITSSGYSYSGPLWSYTMLHKPVSCLPNDLSGDCRVDIGDLAVLCQQWLESVNCSDYDCADLTSDGIVNLEDFVALQENWQEQADPLIVINEIHYHSDYNKDLVEFIELYHAGAAPVDLSGWTISDGISYTFPAGTVLNPNTYITVCQEPTSFFNKFGLIGFGPFEGKLSNEGETITLRDAQGNKIDEVTYSSEFPWPIAANGEGASMELINPYLENDLAGSWRSSGVHYDLPYRAFRSPTPGARNHSFTVNIPPQIRQVQNSPETPLSDDPAIITAKITDADGVDSVTLKYQIVTAGNYIPAYLPVAINSLYDDPIKYPTPNPDFEDPANWTTVAMVDDGSGSDMVAGDNVYTAVIPAQANRTLVRYRIETSDTVGNQVKVPYFDDESLNFAYYVYDGIPDYVTTNNSVSGSVGYTYPSEMLETFPVYTLITRASDFTMCNGNNYADRIDQNTTEFAYQETGRRYNWEGAFVYEGKVYDHIGYRLRGGNGRYNYGMGGKRSMKFRFNRGNYFQARDIYGDKFPSKWQHLNSGKMFGNKISNGYRNYAYGINEIMDMRLFAQASVPSPETWWFHFRIVDGAEETPTASGGQYTGDFYGLYIGFENYDGAMLDRLELPDGNLYKLADKVNDGKEQQRYQGPYSVDNAGDYTNIRYKLTHEATAEFIDKYLDCEQWYRYHTVTEAIRHYDIFSGSDCTHCLKNCAWYFLPIFDENNQYGKLWYLPFDVDDTWGPYWNMGVDHAKAAIYDQRYTNNLEQFTVQPEKEPFKIAYRNYIREFRDLHWQPEVINGMIDELAWLISDFVPADRDRWRYDTTGGGSAIDNGLLETNVEIMKQFAWSSGVEGWMGSNTNLDNLANAGGDSVSIPATPAISYIGTEGYPENDLRFSVSAFSDPQGAGTFGAMKWRIAEHNMDFNSYEPSSSATISLLEKDSNWKYFKGTQEPSAQTGTWRLPDFNDSNWLSGQAPIGYKYAVNTTITDMRYNYTTIYLRNSFFVANAANVSSLTFNALVDDGCIVWINGIEVARLYCSAGEKAYNSTTGVLHHEADYYEQITINNPANFLVNGENTIAVQVIQVDINSSDLAIDIELQANIGGYTHKRLSKNVKYEINPVYESSDLTIYSSDYQFPAEGIKPGRNYRVRCKMMDNTGRWSHWSAPVEFVAGEALGSDIKNYFRLTELMYNNGEADFIEFQNISSNTTLDLSTITIEGGVTFSFANSSVTSLAPGEFVLVVRDKTAFATAYGTAH